MFTLKSTRRQLQIVTLLGAVLYTIGQISSPLKLIYINEDLLLQIYSEVEFPVKCFYTISPRVVKPTQTQKIEDNLYQLMVKHEGNYYCEDANKSISNAVLITRAHWENSTSQDMEPRAGQPVGSINRELKFEDDHLCSAQIIQDLNGQVQSWPPINEGESYLIKGDGCLLAVRTCVWKPDVGYQLIEPLRWDPSWPPHCPMVEMNLTQAVHELQIITSKREVKITDLSLATAIVSKALQINYTTLKAHQEDTNLLIRGLDLVLTRIKLQPGKSITFTQPELSVFVMNVETNMPLGIALTDVSEDMTNSSTHILNSPLELQNLSRVDIAIFPRLFSKKGSHISLAFFNDDSAFRESRWKTNSRVVSVNMEELKSVDILFRPVHESSEKRCAFWDFNMSSGSWSVDGCVMVASPSDSHDMCHCTHLTHFAEIIAPSWSMEADAVLDVISLVGCSLSLLGLLGIFVTGALFWHWRAQLGNKILLHLSTAVALNMLVFLITATGMLPELCMPLGAILHYSILTTFCWMLVCAGLQFIRLVSVLGTHYTSHLLMKTSLFAWGAPLIPVCVLLIIDTHSYEPNGRGLCYPTGLAFYLSVLCPVLVIVTVNLIVFGTILHRLFENNSIQRHIHSEKALALRRFMTSLLLFFLLGINWVFGLIGGLSKVSAYIFCVTATLQGFILFLFFVIGEKKTRCYWTEKSSVQKPSSTSITPTERHALRHTAET